MRKFPLLIILLIFAAGVGAVSGKVRNAGVSDTDAAKADYMFLEAMRYLALDDEASAYSLLARAHQLNPSDKEIGLELVMPLLQLSDGDSTMVSNAVGLLRDYRNEYPSDYYSGIQYALLSERLGNRSEALRTWGVLHHYYPDDDAVTGRYAGALGRAGSRDSLLRAIAIYDSIEALRGSDLQLTTQKLQLYYQMNDTSAILNEMARLRASNPSEVEYTIISGDLNMMFKRHDQARELYEQACATDSTSGHARYALANYYKETGDSTAYDREVMKALDMADLGLDDKLGIMQDYVSTMYADSLQQPRIRQLFDNLIVQHPSEAEIHEMYGRYLASCSDYAEAAQQFEIALGLHPDNETGWVVLCTLYFSTEDYDALGKAVDKAIHYFPESSSFHHMKGTMHALKEERQEAVDEYRKALDLTPETDNVARSDIYTSIGDSYYSMEKTDSAYSYYRTALLYNPDNALALNNAAYFMACSGDNLDEALTMIQKAIELRPDDINSLDSYAWVLFKRKDYTGARELIDRVLEMMTNPSGEVLEHAGDIYFMDGEPDRAVDYWKQALELDPDNELLQRKVKHRTYFFK